MLFHWQIEDRDIQAVTDVVSRFQNHPIVRQRQERNVDGSGRSPLTKKSFWQSLLGGLLTTQQKSGVGNPVVNFLELDPHPLSLQVCLAHSDLKVYAQEEMIKHGGIRRHGKIAEQIETNLNRLQKQEWNILDVLRTQLPFDDQAVERQVAYELAALLNGIGPKQSRNMLQGLGLTKYEIPLDSRIFNWINRQGFFPIRITSQGLADQYFYEFVLDAIQLLCTKAGVLPCIFDAAVFASVERT